MDTATDGIHRLVALLTRQRTTDALPESNGVATAGMSGIVLEVGAFTPVEVDRFSGRPRPRRFC